MMRRTINHGAVRWTLLMGALAAATIAVIRPAGSQKDAPAPPTPPQPAAPAAGVPLKPVEPPKPTYVGSDKCTPCHKEIAAKYQTGRNGNVATHAALFQASLPEAMRGCEACHGPGSLHLDGEAKGILNPAKMKPDPAKMKPNEADAFCLKCHGADSSSVLSQNRGGDSASVLLTSSVPASVPSSWQKFSTRHWLRGKHARKGVACVACHSEHLSGEEHKLKKDANALCADCHADMKAKEGVYQHRPIKGGECLECHESHATRRPSLTKPTVDATCADCHDPEDADFSKTHSGYDMKGTRCTTCHVAHIKEKGSKGLMPHQHTPFGERKCTLCHQPSTASKKATLIKPADELCVRCHADTVKEDNNSKAMRVHDPVKERFCLGCHDPHGSRQSRAPLFKASTENTCTTCHTDVDLKCAQPVKHLPVEAGNCLACHIGHKSQHESLLTKSSIDLCQSCHPDEHKVTHPIGVREKGNKKEIVADPRNGKMMTCVSCHEVHAGAHQFLTTQDWRRDLCVQCHKVDQPEPAKKK